jgi:uncharacterized protein YjbI with pentapeptide repeats
LNKNIEWKFTSSIDNITTIYFPGTWYKTKADAEAMTRVDKLKNSTEDRREEIYNILIQDSSPVGMKRAGIKAKELEEMGLRLNQLKTAGFTASELITEGFTSDQLKQAGFTADELTKEGFTSDQLKQAGFSDDETRAANTRTVVNRLTSSAEDRREEIYKILIQNSSYAYMKNAGIKAKELEKMGSSLGKLKEAGFTARELTDEGFNPNELKEAGFTAAELKDARMPLNQILRAGFSAAELKEAKFTAANLKEAGFNLFKLKDAQFTAAELKEAKFTAAELKIVNFSAAELKDAGFNANELYDAGFQLFDGGGKSGSNITRKRRLRLKKSRNITRHKGGKKSVRFSARVKLNNGNGNGKGSLSMNKKTRKVSCSSYKLSARRVIKLKR